DRSVVALTEEAATDLMQHAYVLLYTRRQTVPRPEESGSMHSKMHTMSLEIGLSLDFENVAPMSSRTTEAGGGSTSPSLSSKSSVTEQTSSEEDNMDDEPKSGRHHHPSRQACRPGWSGKFGQLFLHKRR